MDDTLRSSPLDLSDCSSTPTDSLTLQHSVRFLMSTVILLQGQIDDVGDVFTAKIEKDVNILNKESFSDHLTRDNKKRLKHLENVLQNAVISSTESLAKMRTALKEIQIIYSNITEPMMMKTQHKELKVQDKQKIKIPVSPTSERGQQKKCCSNSADLLQRHKNTHKQHQTPNHSSSDKLVHYSNLNAPDITTKAARFFVMITRIEDSINESVHTSLWSSTPNENRRLDKAFKERDGKGSIFLFFRVIGSDQFCGMARMLTSINHDIDINGWKNDRCRGHFHVEWIYLKNIPNRYFEHIHLENNRNMPLTYSLETQEIPYIKGNLAFKIMQNFRLYEPS
ncbi:YTH domain-containing protein 1-like [Mytilus trossulus]|uniref:YTH domain-containing protein 1-like n=1 Tax=Mytilus trossulus TaxID=6551 RepID=UPI003007487F